MYAESSVHVERGIMLQFSCTALISNPAVMPTLPPSSWDDCLQWSLRCQNKTISITVSDEKLILDDSSLDDNDAYNDDDKDKENESGIPM